MMDETAATSIEHNRDEPESTNPISPIVPSEDYDYVQVLDIDRGEEEDC